MLFLYDALTAYASIRHSAVAAAALYSRTSPSSTCGLPGQVHPQNLHPGNHVKRLALKYRPRTFEQVVGQEYPKRIMSQLILNGQSCANLLLHGSVGSGKTTLVRIYAGALNCETPTATGDRCFGCDRCRPWMRAMRRASSNWTPRSFEK